MQLGVAAPLARGVETFKRPSTLALALLVWMSYVSATAARHTLGVSDLRTTAAEAYGVVTADELAASASNDVFALSLPLSDSLAWLVVAGAVTLGVSAVATTMRIQAGEAVDYRAAVRSTLAYPLYAAVVTAPLVAGGSFVLLDSVGMTGPGSEMLVWLVFVVGVLATVYLTSTLLTYPYHVSVEGLGVLRSYRRATATSKGFRYEALTVGAVVGVPAVAAGVFGSLAVATVVPTGAISATANLAVLALVTVYLAGALSEMSAELNELELDVPELPKDRKHSEPFTSTER
ncbi:MAG: hypothetical protein ACOCT0_04605 [Halobacteriota archaeon]